MDNYNLITATTDWYLNLIKDDPVRPHLAAAWRIKNGRSVYVLENPNTGLAASVVCVALTQGVALTEQELERTHAPDTAMFYTVWSYERGAGRAIIFRVRDLILETDPRITRFVTLSPLTEMAEQFHTRNGAVLIDRGTTCQNFEYA